MNTYTNPYLLAHCNAFFKLSIFFTFTGILTNFACLQHQNLSLFLINHTGSIKKTCDQSKIISKEIRKKVYLSFNIFFIYVKNPPQIKYDYHINKSKKKTTLVFLVKYNEIVIFKGK